MMNRIILLFMLSAFVLSAKEIVFGEKRGNVGQASKTLVRYFPDMVACWIELIVY